MQFPFRPKIALAIVAVLTAFASPFASGQEAPKIEASKGLPPRSSPGDYQAQGKAGRVTIGAEFTAHSVSIPDALFTTDDYVVVEVGMFGPPDAHLPLSYQDFSLRINGKKNAEPSQSSVMVFKSLKDPSYDPPELAKPKESKGGINTGGAAGQNDGGSLPPVVHIPIGIERAMEQKVQKAAFPEGDRPLPAAGVLFFEHRGKTSSAELIYNGPAGKATLTLAP